MRGIGGRVGGVKHFCAIQGFEPSSRVHIEYLVIARDHKDEKSGKRCRRLAYGGRMGILRSRGNWAGCR